MQQPFLLYGTHPVYQSINQFSKDVRINSSGGRLVMYKYAQEVQTSKK